MYIHNILIQHSPYENIWPLGDYPGSDKWLDSSYVKTVRAFKISNSPGPFQLDEIEKVSRTTILAPISALLAITSFQVIKGRNKQEDYGKTLKVVL